MCVVYYAWGPEAYLRFAYVSLRSQFAYTDVYRVDVKAFVSPELVDTAKALLSEFPNVEVHAMISTVRCAYALASHAALVNYEN
jgi:hypothetical protein